MNGLKMFLLFPAAALGVAFSQTPTPRLHALNDGQMKLLTNQSFSMRVNSQNELLLEGQWPHSCSRSSEVTVQNKNNFNVVEVLVSESCFNELKLKPAALKKRTRRPMGIVIPLGEVYPNDPFILTSSTLELDLNLKLSEQNADHFFKEGEEGKNGPSNSSRDPALDSNKMSDNFYFQKCQTEASINLEGLDQCGNSSSWKMGAQVQLNDHASVRGGTILEQKQEQDARYEIEGKPGFQMEFLYNFGQ